MIKFPDYRSATNAAYDTLIKYREFSFPISPIRIIRQLDHVALHTYYDLIERRGFSRILFINFFVSSEHGFTAKHKNDYIIYYNEQKDTTTIRFTLAHELGHIILGHTRDGYAENQEANCFARNLLCPIPAIIEMSLQTENEYIDAFNISEPMAYYAMKHRSSDYHYISRDNYNYYNDNVYSYYTGISLAEMYGIPGVYY